MQNIGHYTTVLYVTLFTLVVPLIAHGQQGINNPLDQNRFPDLTSFLTVILDSVIIILFPILVLVAVFSGFMLVKAQGNPQLLGEAKNRVLWVFIGSIIILAASTIIFAVSGTVDEILP